MDKVRGSFSCGRYHNRSRLLASVASLRLLLLQQLLLMLLLLLLLHLWAGAFRL